MKYLIVFVLFCTISIQLFALTENEVFCYIKQVGIKSPEIVLRQAIYESGHFKSNIFKKKNNLFGFRHRHYVHYKSWKECIDYYKVWQDRYYTNDSIDYYVFLQNKNFTGRKKVRYAHQLKKIKITSSLICLADERQAQ